MKTKFFWIHAALAMLACSASAQGTFIFDQQSSTESNVLDSEVQITSQNQPLGQSFTPSLSSVGFVRLYLAGFGTGTNTAVFVNLLSGSISGTILSSSDPVFVPAGSPPAPVNFIFNDPVTVTPGEVYYFQPVLQSGDAGSVLYGSYEYPAGNAFFQGRAYDGLPPNYQDRDLWFREGIVAVPEPSSATLVLVGLGVLVGARFVKKQR